MDLGSRDQYGGSMQMRRKNWNDKAINSGPVSFLNLAELFAVWRNYLLGGGRSLVIVIVWVVAIFMLKLKGETQ